MSTSTTTSSSLPRAYIGSRRSRSYINNTLPTSSLSNDYIFSTTSSSKSFQPIQSEQRDDLLNTETADALQTQQEERATVKNHLYETPLDEEQLHRQREQKAKGFLPTSTPSSYSSSLFLSPTTHNDTHLSGYDRSPPSFLKEQPHFHHPSHQYEQHPYWQPLNNNNNQVLLKTFDQEKHNKSSYYNQNSDLHDIPEENNSLSSSSSYSLSDTIVGNNNNDNQSHHLTSTPILPSFPLYQSTISNNIFPLLSSNKNNNNKPLPLTLDSSNDQSSSTISTSDLLNDLQRKADVYQLNNMSSIRHSSNLNSGTLHPYDQRITDQGNKYIIQLKTDEYQENDFIITPRYSLNQLIIDAKHREEDHCGGYIHRELHKIFNIPKHIDLDRRTTSYNKTTQELTIEMPYLQTLSTTNEINTNNDSSFISPKRNTTQSSTYLYGNNNGNILSTRSDYHKDSNNTSGIGTTDSTLIKSSNSADVGTNYGTTITNTKPFDFDLFHRSAFRPQIVRTTTNDANTNEKKIIMSLDLSDYQAEDIKVSVNDRELIVKAERKIETDKRKSRSSFYQSTTLPPQTDVEHLQSNYIDGKLTIEAPYIEQNNTDRRLKTTTSSNQEGNWQIVTELEQKTTTENPFQHRTETVEEFVRRRRL